MIEKDMISFFCSLRESLYQQWRQSGLQRGRPPQNLQKHWDWNVSLFGNSELMLNVCATLIRNVAVDDSKNIDCQWYDTLQCLSL